MVFGGVKLQESECGAIRKAIEKIGLSQKPTHIGMITTCQRVGLRVGPKKNETIFI